MDEKSQKKKNKTNEGEFRRDDEPFTIPSFTNRWRIQSISAGTNHLLVISRNRELFAWGNNKYGQLGLGKITTTVYEPTRIDEFLGVSIKQASCGNDYSIVLTDCGELFSFGSLLHGRLGLGSVSDGCQLVPTKINVSFLLISIGNSCNALHLLWRQSCSFNFRLAFK